MISNTVLGLISLGVPLLIIGFLALRRLPWVFAFFLALLAAGLGYIHSTGAARDIGRKVRAELPAGMLPERNAEPAAGNTAAPASPPPEAPAMAPAPTTPAPATTPPPAAPAPANP
jgi:hypothetical protein